jgi:hypothetical protein
MPWPSAVKRAAKVSLMLMTTPQIELWTGGGVKRQKGGNGKWEEFKEMREKKEERNLD